MHIGLIIYGSLDTLSGGYLYDRKLVEFLRSRGDTVEIISLPWRNYAAHLSDNLWFRLQSRSTRARSLDLVIQDELTHPSLLFANRGKHPFPVVSLIHHLRCSEQRPDWQNRFYRFIEKRYLESVDGFIFNSKTTRNVVQGMLSRGKPSVTGYPPTDRFGAPLPEHEIVERSRTGDLRVLFLGNVIYRKGLHTLLEAVKGMASPIRIDVVGSLAAEPVYAKLIEEIIAKHGLTSSVVLHGPLDQQPLIEKLKQAHVLAVPSSYEGFGIVYLEGMCFGLPAIGTTAGAAAEIIDPGRTGYLIEPGDSAALTKHLQSLSADRGLLVRLSLHARQRYLRQPSWNESASSIRDFLFSLL